MTQSFLLGACRCTRDHQHNERCAYRLSWSLNPYMQPREIRIEDVLAQHEELQTELSQLGATLQVLPFVDGAYDSVFIKDNGILFEQRGSKFCILGRPRHAERTLELESRAQEFADLGFQLRFRPDSHFEGGDFVYAPKRGFGILGYGLRSEKRSASTIAKAMGIEVLAVELRDPWLYHLDMALAVLADGTCFACPEAFSPSSWAALREAFRHDEFVTVSQGDARSFGLNWIETHQGIVQSARAQQTRRMLEERGYQTRSVGLGEFEAAGGSAACLVNRIWAI